MCDHLEGFPHVFEKIPQRVILSTHLKKGVRVLIMSKFEGEERNHVRIQSRKRGMECMFGKIVGISGGFCS